VYTGFLIREPFTQLPVSLPDFSSFESSNVTLKLPHKQLSVLTFYRPPPSATRRVPFSKFLDEFSSFLSLAATPHEFIITGDFNIHLDNLTDTLTSQFLSVLSSFNLTHHADFPTHDKNHIHILFLQRNSLILKMDAKFHVCYYLQFDDNKI